MTQDELYNEAKAFIVTCYQELQHDALTTERRLFEIRQRIEMDGTYEHTYEELEYGAKMAWRNNNRCIGRLFWQTLKVLDRRDCRSEREVAEAVYQHIQYATNQGKIRPTITIFPAKTQKTKVRIWNHQLLRYAGYETTEGCVGDPHSIPFTRVCHSLGWQGTGTHFDILPLVVQVDRRPPKWFEIPPELVLEVPISHPEYAWFADLHLKWYATPLISDMALEIGGIRYTAAPFNGWYMETEIGARNLADEKRYHMLPKIADLMGLNRQTERSLWRDKALVELNLAVIHSFQQKGVNMVDHHTAAKQFMRFEQQEAASDRAVTGNWAWLIPPISPATTHIFHQRYDNVVVKPNYFYQRLPY